jgi:PBSX family phage terminase large subunit
MADKGNYFYCHACGTLEFKLEEQDTPWIPLPRQELFLYAMQMYAMYVGGVGSGKTMSGAYKAIMKTLEHPGGMGLVGAQTYPQLRDATMHTFFQVCPEKLMWKGNKDKAFSKTDAILTMANEHQILFRPLDDESKLRSLNLVWFWIDEASEVAKEIFYMLQSRLRSRQGFIDGIARHQGWVTTNPAGRDWLWEIFVALNDPNYFWVNAPTRENKYLPPNFEADLRKRWPEAWVKRFLDGSFDVFEGQIYPMLDIEMHSQMPVWDFEDQIHQVPSGWPVFVSGDHGFTNPTSIGFYTIAPGERVIRFDEHYDNNKPVSFHAQKIKEKLWSWGVNPANVQDWVLDPSTKGQKGMEGRAVMQEYHDHGIPFRPANNQVQAGILQVIEYLMPNAITNHPMFLMHRRCVNAYREMGGYRWKPRPAASVSNEPEEPVKKDDHTCDEIRYFLMTRPRIDKLVASNPFEIMQRKIRGHFQLDEKNMPFALRTNSNFNGAGAWPNNGW